MHTLGHTMTPVLFIATSQLSSAGIIELYPSYTLAYTNGDGFTFPGIVNYYGDASSDEVTGIAFSSIQFVTNQLSIINMATAAAYGATAQSASQASLLFSVDTTYSVVLSSTQSPPASNGSNSTSSFVFVQDVDDKHFVVYQQHDLYGDSNPTTDMASAMLQSGHTYVFVQILNSLYGWGGGDSGFRSCDIRFLS